MRLWGMRDCLTGRGKGEFATDTRGDGGGGIEVVSGRVFRSQRESFSREAGGEALDLQIDKTIMARPLAGCQVFVHQHLDGSLSIAFGRTSSPVLQKMEIS